VELTGIHHLTAVTADVRRNFRFYTGDLGMRLVKRSVNQDDVSAYHLFYADGAGTPGTDITFFDWRVPRKARGNHTISRTALLLPDERSIRWWSARLAGNGRMSEPEMRDGRLTLDFEDPEGQRLSLIAATAENRPFHPWTGSPVPAEHQIRGLGPIELSIPDLAPTELVLTRLMEMRKVREYPHAEESSHTVHVFEMGSGGAGAELHVAVRPGFPVARPGAGGVHHIAFRVADDETHRAWLDRLDRAGIGNSGVVDRYYFKSLYFREPNGILFEIATDGPGFAVDEDQATLGDTVVLPPFLEHRRETIVANLLPIE
jgi:glyoxalase family protein